MAAVGGAASVMERSLRQRLADLLGRDPPDDLDELDDLASGEKEDLESDLIGPPGRRTGRGGRNCTTAKPTAND
jgi:hypothetical protein